MASELSAGKLMLLDAWQHRFPLVPQPFAVLAHKTGLDERDVVLQFQRWHSEGVLSRIGPVLHPACFVGALVAMQVANARLEEVAAYVTALEQVNHNYQREHTLNLWFVVACRSQQGLQQLMQQVLRDTGCMPVLLPMQQAYHVDLGFSLSAAVKTPARMQPTDVVLPPAGSAALSLLYLVQQGIPLTARPYQWLAQRAGLSEQEVLYWLEHWLDDGLFRRFGVVLHHRKLGYGANAMCVWDVDDARVDALGQCLGQQSGVTLCYRRQRHLPAWRYNLFCMIHGKQRAAVLQRRSEIASQLGLDTWPHDTLFSTRCFKQRGAQLPLQPHPL